MLLNAHIFLETRKNLYLQTQEHFKHGNTICARKIRKHETKCIVFLMAVSNQDEKDLLNLASVWLIIGLWGGIFGVLFSNPTNISWWLSVIISRRYSVGPAKPTRLITGISLHVIIVILWRIISFYEELWKTSVLRTFSLRSL